MTSSQLNKIAFAYDTLPHTPKHLSYVTFKADILAQYKCLLDLGIRVIPCTALASPKSAEEVFLHLDHRVLMVDVESGGMFEMGHPLVDSPFCSKCGNISFNTMFRAVHDFYGHYLGQYDFSLEGELAAYRAARKMFRPMSQDALFGETVAQLAYYFTMGEFVPVQRAVIYQGIDYGSI